MKTCYVDHSEHGARDLVDYGARLTRIMDRYLRGFENEAAELVIDQDELIDSLGDIWEINNLMKDVFDKLHDDDKADHNLKEIMSIIEE